MTALNSRGKALCVCVLLALASTAVAWLTLDRTAISAASADRTSPPRSKASSTAADRSSEPRASGIEVQSIDAELAPRDVQARERRVRRRAEPRREPVRLPYGSLETNRPGWVQAGPEATANPNATAGLIDSFEAMSCVATTACPDGRPIALNTQDKREDFLRGLIDDRVTWLLISVASEHQIVVGSARSSHSRYVQDRSGRAVDSNHAYGRAADIMSIDGVPCKAETAGQSFTKGFDNPFPDTPGPCASLGAAINSLPSEDRPTEVIFYFDVGEPAGVAMENHDDHLHIGFNAF